MKNNILKLLFTCSILGFTLIGCSNTGLSNNTERQIPQVRIIGKDNQHVISVKNIDNSSMESEYVETEVTMSSETKEPELILETKIHKAKTLTTEEKNTILKEINTYQVTNKETLNELIVLIDENIASFDVRERDLIVKKYILNMYDLMNALNKVLGVIGYDLEVVVNEYDIKVNDRTSIQSIPDSYGTVKGFLLEVKDKGFFMNSVSNKKDYYIDLDLGNVLEKYRDYMSPSMISYLEFNNYEMNNTMILSESSTYDLKEIVNRINMLTTGLELDKSNNYIMTDKYTSSLIYYYQLLLGLSHNQFVDDTYKINNTVLNEFKTIQSENINTILGNVLEKTVLAIELNNGIYSKDIQNMVNDYVNSLIYTEEIRNVINTDINSKYEILTQETSVINEEKLVEELTETSLEN